MYDPRINLEYTLPEKHVFKRMPAPGRTEMCMRDARRVLS